MHVSGVKLRDFRNYESAEVQLADGLTIIHGPVGAGKTNLLEAIYFGCVTRSCRTSNDRDLIRFGARTTRVGVNTVDGAESHLFEVGLESGREKVVRVDGAPAASAASERPLFSVFMPDRLELVKGPAALRRAHLDNLIAAFWPARRETRVSYGRALAQRNALLGRVRSGAASAAVLTPWNHQLALRGIELMADRREALDALARGFTSRVAELGLESVGVVAYRPCSDASSADDLEAELQAAQSRDVERGFSTHGPHRDDFKLSADERDLRRFGSQGQQRIALLALLLAERDALLELRSVAPVMLMDDVLSELDEDRRDRLLSLLGAAGQALLTTADPASAQIAAEAEAHTLPIAAGGSFG